MTTAQLRTMFDDLDDAVLAVAVAVEDFEGPPSMLTALALDARRAIAALNRHAEALSAAQLQALRAASQVKARRRRPVAG
jgi:hypothetical protein